MLNKTGLEDLKALAQPKPLLDRRGWALFLAVGFVLIVLVPLFNLLPGTGSALHLPGYLIPLLGKYACYAILALSLDLVWGYAGILSLGHGAFFALGGYAMGMYLMRQIGTRGVYGHPELPDFMVFLNWKELPWYWYGFEHFPFALLMVFLVPGLLNCGGRPVSVQQRSAATARIQCAGVPRGRSFTSMTMGITA